MSIREVGEGLGASSDKLREAAGHCQEARQTLEGNNHFASILDHIHQAINELRLQKQVTETAHEQLVAAGGAAIGACAELNLKIEGTGEDKLRALTPRILAANEALATGSMAICDGLSDDEDSLVEQLTTFIDAFESLAVVQFKTVTHIDTIRSTYNQIADDVDEVRGGL